MGCTEESGVIEANVVVRANQFDKFHWSSVFDLRAFDLVELGGAGLRQQAIASHISDFEANSAGHWIG